MFVVGMQHGMWWVGNPIRPEQHSGVPYGEAANRLGSWSGLMALLVAGISTGRAIGPGDGFIGLWIGDWPTAWLIAVPVVPVAAPLARRAVTLLADSRP